MSDWSDIKVASIITSGLTVMVGIIAWAAYSITLAKNCL